MTDSPLPVLTSPLADLKSAFDQAGFVIVRRFLPPDDLAELQHELQRYIRDVVPTLPAEDAFYVDRGQPATLKQMQHMDRDPYFERYRSQPRWQELATALLGEPCTAMAPEWFNKPPGTSHPTPPHQDNFYFCLKPPQVVTLWLALDPVDDENGCLRFVSGSHRRGMRPHALTKILGFSQGITDYGPADEADEVRAHLAPGDLVAHHGQMIHRADPNRTSGRHRRAFAMVFRGASCQRDEAAFARYQEALTAQHAAT